MSNLLQYEDSPYLYAHKDNPFHWYPWCDEAFLKAKQENKAIFISIGYSTCHWCHIMEKEVFNSIEIAEYMNENFVCIKVDKEQRPDIDIYYQKVYQTLTKKAGGWPTSIFCTPQREPIYAATYIPPEPDYNIVGFKQLVHLITEKISEQDELFYKDVQNIQTLLENKQMNTKSDALTLEIAETFLKQCKDVFEPTYGGFTITPKFPQTSMLEALMILYILQPKDEIKEIITHTLDNMVAGGFYDLVDGGFCRYSTDIEWFVPHFEKMTYDNALLCELYLRAYYLFGSEDYLQIAKETADFMIEKMYEDGYFYSASDADSGGVEGAYFTYSRKELINAIKVSGFNDAEAKKMTMRLLVSTSGNYDNRNILHFANIQREEWFLKIQPALQKIRKEKKYPFIDKKMQTSWSSMMIRSLFMLGVKESYYLDIAKNSLDKLMLKMYQNFILHHTSLIDKEVNQGDFLEDYAYAGVMLIEAYQVTSLTSYLLQAKELADLAIARFFKNGKWNFSVGEFATLAPLDDASYPSAVSVMIDLLLSLGSLMDGKYRKIARDSLEYFASELNKNPSDYPNMSMQVLRYLKEDYILKVPMYTHYKEILAHSTYPFTLVSFQDTKEYELCSNSKCFIKCKTLEELLGSF